MDSLLGGILAFTLGHAIFGNKIDWLYQRIWGHRIRTGGE